MIYIYIYIRAYFLLVCLRLILKTSAEHCNKLHILFNVFLLRVSFWQHTKTAKSRTSVSQPCVPLCIRTMRHSIYGNYILQWMLHWMCGTTT